MNFNGSITSIDTEDLAGAIDDGMDYVEVLDFVRYKDFNLRHIITMVKQSKGKDVQPEIEKLGGKSCLPDILEQYKIENENEVKDGQDNTVQENDDVEVDNADANENDHSNENNNDGNDDQEQEDIDVDVDVDMNMDKQNDQEQDENQDDDKENENENENETEIENENEDENEQDDDDVEEWEDHDGYTNEELSTVGGENGDFELDQATGGENMNDNDNDQGYDDSGDFGFLGGTDKARDTNDDIDFAQLGQCNVGDDNAGTGGIDVDDFA